MTLTTETSTGLTSTLHNEDHLEFTFLESTRDTFLHQHVTEPTRGKIGQNTNTFDLIFTNEKGIKSTNLQDIKETGEIAQTRGDLIGRVNKALLGFRYAPDIILKSIFNSKCAHLYGCQGMGFDRQSCGSVLYHLEQKV